MAQTKRKRQTKHRGNAAGSVVNRGRTGRPPTAEERKAKEKEQARVSRAERPFKQPTWNSALLRGALAAVFIFIFLMITDKHEVLVSVIFAIGACILYVPSGYYLETYMWRRRMRRAGRPLP